jgi:hypothetical protein
MCDQSYRALGGGIIASRVRVPGCHSNELWLVVLLFAALTLGLTYPLSLHPGSTSLGSDPDVHTFTWTLGWDVHAFLHRPWTIVDANIFFPYRRTLAFSENLIGSALVAAPVVWLTGNYVLAMNVVAMLSVGLCGVGAYVLARRIGLTVGAAVICGVIFAFSPARFFRFPQIHLTAIQWIPFTLAFLHTYFQEGRPRDLRLAIAFFTLQGLTSLHGAVYLSIAVAVFLIHRLCLGAPLELTRRLRDIGALGAMPLLALVMLAAPYLQVQKEMGLVRTLENWIPAWESFLASPTHVHAWLLARLFDTPINERASAFLFPGYLPIVLALAAVVSPRVHRRALLLYLAVAMIALLLSARPPISVWPYVYWLPGFNFIRIPSRFFLLAVLGLAVVGAIGFERLATTLQGKRRRAATVVVCALLVVECAAIPLPLTPYTVEFASVDRWLARQPAPFGVAEVPVGAATRYHSTYMLHSMAHWQKTVHGHSSLLPALHERLYDQLRSFPDEGSLRTLTDIGVTYIVVHTDFYKPGEWEAVERALDGYASRLILQHEDSSGRVYRLVK